jgi:hypothetical protein
MPPLIDHACLVGAPARLERADVGALLDDSTWLNTIYQPALLASFSPHGPTPPASAIAAFCLPSGLPICVGPLAPAKAEPRFSCFVLTQGDGTRLYGHCLTVHEPLSLSVEVQLTPSSPTSRDDEALAAGVRPTAAVRELAGTRTAYAPRCLCLLSLAHYPLAFKASLLALYKMVASTREQGAATLALPVEACLTHLTLNVPRPLPDGPTVRFALGNGTLPLHVDCSPPTQLPFTDYSLCELLARLEPLGLVRLFHAAVLEQQIVVVCDDPELRLAACELILLLLHPLEWAHVYVPTIPDDLLGLLANPFPCVLGLRSEQAAHLPKPLPDAMAVLTLPSNATPTATPAAAHLTVPRAELAPLPPRESSALVASLFAAVRHGRAVPRAAATPAAASRDATTPPPSAAIAAEDLIETAAAWDAEQTAAAAASAADVAVVDEAATADAARAPAMLEARTRGAFLRFFVSLLRDLHRFVPEGDAPAPASAEGAGGGAAGWQAEADQFERQVSHFLEAQPAASQPFLREFMRTQLFLSFVQPPMGADSNGGGTAAGAGGRGGRCFQLVRDAFLQRELSQAAERERLNSKEPLPISAELLSAAAKKQAAAGGAKAASTATAHAPSAELYDVPPPVLAPSSAQAAPSAGYRYPDGLPTSLPEELRAEKVEMPVFAGEPPPPPRVSAAVRAAWAEALAELEDRDQKRTGAQLAAGIGGGLIVGGAAAAMLCSVQ